MLNDEALAEPPNLDEMLRQPASPQAWRRRYLIGGLTAMLVGVVLLAMAGPLLAQRFFPTQRAFSLLVRSNVSWGQVTLGYQGHDHPIRLDQTLSLPEDARPYLVVLVMRAAPFMSRSCAFTVPLAKGDSCLDDHALVLEDANKLGQLAQANGLRLTIGFALADLPAPQRAPLLQWVTAQVIQTAPQLSVPAGAHYPDGQIFRTIHLAQTPLVATLLTTPGDVGVGPDLTCSDLCAPEDGEIVTSTMGATWQVRLVVSQSWDFRRASDGLEVGYTIESVNLPAIAFTLMYQPDRDQWTFATPVGPTLNQVVQNQLCHDGLLSLEALFLSAGTNVSQLNVHPRMVDDHHLAGCLLQVASTQGSATAEFLWQLGQLYTANPYAQSVESALPVANAQDMATFASGL